MTNETTSGRLTPEKFPHLSRFALTDDELSALARQGFIRSETRGTKTVYRLRYRVHGQQRVRYVSPRDVLPLETELALWQGQVRARRRLNGVAALARGVLAYRRSTLGPLLEARGYHFHGHQIRRFRNT